MLTITPPAKKCLSCGSKSVLMELIDSHPYQELMSCKKCGSTYRISMRKHFETTNTDTGFRYAIEQI